MIVVSFSLIVVAVGLLAAGLWLPSSVLLSASIAASLLAAVTLVVGARRAASPEATAGTPGRVQDLAEDRPVRQRRGYAAGRDQPAAPSQVVDGAGAGAGAEPVTATIPAIPAQGGATAWAPAGTPESTGTPAERSPDEDPDPPDEPAPQQVSATDAERVSRLATEVLVVDGRPRYHLAGCVHLLGRESEPLPVSEAIELGFGPCSLCEPDSALLADHRRG